MGRLNKPARDGYTYRSPGQTNARDITPNLRENVAASQKADIDRIKRGLDTSETRPQNRSQVQNAAGRAVTRSGGRAGLASLALEAGLEAGKKLEEQTGLGKKFVDKSGLGDAVEKAIKRRDKVELSKDSKERLEDMDTDRIMREVDSERKARRYAEKDEPTEYRGDDEYKKGGAVRGWGIARGARKAKMR